MQGLSKNDEGIPSEWVDARNLIYEALNLIYLQNQEAPQSIVVEMPTFDCPFYCRPTQMTQVILNLVSNSLDAIENQTDGIIRVILIKEEFHLVFHVIDNGPGIPKNIQNNITQPFFTTKTNQKGTGLGLSISRKIIELHQGKLTFSSEPGQTTFTASVPISNLNQFETAQQLQRPQSTFKRS